MSITSAPVTIKDSKLRQVFPSCAQIDSALRIGLEEPDRKVIAVDAELSGRLLQYVLEDLYTLKNQFGWRVLLHHSFRDCGYANYLGLDDFYDFHTLDPQDGFAHLVIADSKKAHRPYPLFAPEHAVFAYNSSHCPEALSALEMIINHGRIMSPHDPRLRPATKDELRKDL